MAEEATIISLMDRRGRRSMAYILEQYQKAHPEEDPALIEPHLIAEWAIKRGIYNRPPMSPEERLRRELSRYLKSEYTQDPQGRNVRKHHCVIYTVETTEGLKRRSRWWVLYNAPPEEIWAAFQLRRAMMVSDAVQLSIDYDSYNDNNLHGANLETID